MTPAPVPPPPEPPPWSDVPGPEPIVSCCEFIASASETLLIVLSVCLICSPVSRLEDLADAAVVARRFDLAGDFRFVLRAVQAELAFGAGDLATAALRFLVARARVLRRRSRPVFRRRAAGGGGSSSCGAAQTEARGVLVRVRELERLVDRRRRHERAHEPEDADVQARRSRRARARRGARAPSTSPIGVAAVEYWKKIPNCPYCRRP